MVDSKAAMPSISDDRIVGKTALKHKSYFKAFSPWKTPLVVVVPAKTANILGLFGGPSDAVNIGFPDRKSNPAIRRNSC
jgi:hypothetical protein